MNKSKLLGGAARVVREPSRREMAEAMLRRLGAGDVLDGKPAPSNGKQAPSGGSAAKRATT